MKDLRIPLRHEFGQLEERVKFNAEEESYLEDMKRRQ